MLGSRQQSPVVIVAAAVGNIVVAVDFRMVLVVVVVVWVLMVMVDFLNFLVLFDLALHYKLTCCILSKSKHGLCGLCNRCELCCVRMGRRLGDIAQWKSFAGGLTDRTSTSRPVVEAGLLRELLK